MVVAVVGVVVVAVFYDVVDVVVLSSSVMSLSFIVFITPKQIQIVWAAVLIAATSIH